MKSEGTHVIVGTGPLGMAVMEELLESGKQVRMVNRSGRARVPDGVEVLAADISSLQGARQACTAAEVVYHCAKPPYNEWPEKFPPMMEGLIAAMSDTSARLVYGDNLYMYGPVRGEIREDLPYVAEGHKGVTRSRMAQRLLDASKTGVIQATIGRASDFFGPRVCDSALGTLVFGAALQGKPAAVLGNIDVPHTYTYIRDFAKGLVVLGERDEAMGESWHIPSAETLTTRQLLEMVYAEAGRRMKVRVASSFLVRLIGLVKPMIREMNEMMYEFKQPYVVNHDKFVQAFGNPSTSHKDAIRETLAWFEMSQSGEIAPA